MGLLGNYPHLCKSIGQYHIQYHVVIIPAHNLALLLVIRMHIVITFLSKPLWWRPSSDPESQ